MGRGGRRGSSRASLERLAGDAIEVPNPIIVVEVLSPGTTGHDTSAKLAGYFQVASIQHYLIVDSAQQLVIHHRRAGEVIETRIASEGMLALQPPGLELPVDELFLDR